MARVNLFRPISSPSRSFAHGDRVTLDGHTIRFKVDGRARRVSLRIDQARREVVATAPTVRRLGEALDFARSRAVWIAGQMARLPQATALHPGAVITVGGEPCRLEEASGRARRILATETEPMRILAPAGERFAPNVVRLLKAEAKERLMEATAIHAKSLGQPMPVVGFGDAKGRWGSCRQARKRGFGSGVEVGRIRYSWRLILAPPEVLDYVAAHECAHLVEGNHGPDFWALVHQLAGDERPHRRWLRANGAALQAFGEG